jgi:hypothetical protein
VASSRTLLVESVTEPAIPAISARVRLGTSNEINLLHLKPGK